MRRRINREGGGGGQTHSHTQQPRRIMLEREILIRELLRPVDCGASGSVAVDEIAALDHKVFDLNLQYYQSVPSLKAKYRLGSGLKG